MPNALTATEIRQHSSTMFATTDASEPEREASYEHMGHSESINKNIYQTPKAVREVFEIENFCTPLINPTNLVIRLMSKFNIHKTEIY